MTAAITLRLGARGVAVEELQRLLVAHGASLVVDGDFGPRTEAAVIAFQSARGLAADGVAGPLTWAALRAAIAGQPGPALPPPPRERGLVLPLADAQRVTRALYLAGKVSLAALDAHVRRDAATLAAYGYASAESRCQDLYYLLKDHNGGKDPTAPDPADRWITEGGHQVNRTVDCSGGNAWMDGVDRYQPKRMAAAVGYDGWFNTDSKIIDARRVVTRGATPRCYEDVGRPVPGAIIVCASGSPGHKIGHEGRVVGYRGAEWRRSERACWDLIDVVDCAARHGRANALTTGAGWYGTDAMFLRCVMQAS